MFAFPQIVSVPVLTGVGSGTVDWPMIGAVIAWLLVAALVGTLLGVLRTSTTKASTAVLPDLARADDADPADTDDFDVEHDQREAA